MTQKNDPRIITAKFNSKCSKCGKPIKKGDYIYYWPLEKQAVCDCGKTDYENFILSVQDEELYNGRNL